MIQPYKCNIYLYIYISCCVKDDNDFSVNVKVVKEPNWNEKEPVSY